MRRLAILPFALSLSWFVGCGLGGPTELPYPYDGPDDDAGRGGSGGTTSSGAVGPSGTSGTSTSTGTSASSGDASSATTGSVSSSASVGSTTGVTTGGGGGLCTPEVDDPPCVVCAKETCCAEIQACAGDSGCSCWVECVAQTQGAIDQCIGQCGAPSGAILDVLDCASVGCEAECGDIGI